MRFYMIQSRDQVNALNEARGLCQCVRQSFQGIKWMNGETNTLTEWTWAELDRLTNGR